MPKLSASACPKNEPLNLLCLFCLFHNAALIKPCRLTIIVACPYRLYNSGCWSLAGSWKQKLGVSVINIEPSVMS
jgi:hypothetical protein